MPCSKQKSSQHLGDTAHQTTHQTYQNHVIRVTPLATHNISASIMCVFLQHVLKQCFRQVLGSCTSGTMCFTRVQVEKSFWGIWFSGVWKPGKPPRFVEKVPYDSSLSKCECWRNCSISSHVSLDKMTINDPSAPKKNDKLERNNFPLSCLSVQEYFKFQKETTFSGWKIPFYKICQILVRNPTEPGGFNWKNSSPISVWQDARFQSEHRPKEHGHVLKTKIRYVSGVLSPTECRGRLMAWGQSPKCGWELYMAELRKPVGLTKIFSGLFERFSST